MLKNIIILCFTIFSLQSFAQGPANIWYFGTNAGLDFSSGSPVVLSDSEMATLEGCATISNNAGNLLFYTDGLTVYNRNHQVMQNGTGLGGDFSSSQSALIVPKPGTTNSYYIFTVDADAGPNGLQYSEVNMSLDGGMGAVTSVKNVMLITPTTEQLVATKKNGEDAYWVVSHKYESNEYIAYEVTTQGVSHNPVVSAIGSAIDYSNNIGQTKFSHQRDRLASARKDEVQVFDFNNSTGELSNLISLNFNENFYGLEFSPSGRLLYASHFDSGLFFGGGVRQFNLYSNDEEEITYTSINLTLDQNALFGALQLAPDGKIYVARVDDVKLDIIENPDAEGEDCNYNQDGIYLDGNISIFGLPTFIQPYFRATFMFCVTEDTQFISEILGDYDSLIWDFGDGTTSTEENPIHNFPAQGDYEVTLTVYSAGQIITTSKVVTILNETNTYDAEIIQCDDVVPDGFTSFDLNSYDDVLIDIVDIPRTPQVIVSYYQDSNHSNEIVSGNFTNTENPQNVFAVVENLETGCVYNFEVTLNVTNELLGDINIDNCIHSSLNGITDFDLGEASIQILNSAPVNLSITFYETFDEAIDLENPLPSTFTNSIPYSQTIYARAENGGVCYGIYPVVLNAYEIPDILESEDVFICADSGSESLVLNTGIVGVNSGNYTFNWSTGEVSSEIEINSGGTYSVVVTTQNGCTVEKTINVLTSSIANIEDIEIRGHSDNNSVAVLTSGDGDYVYALNDINGIYQESNIFYNVSPGIYTVYVKDNKAGCGIVEEEFSVIGFPKFFTPNEDAVNDTWELLGTSAQFRITATIEIYNRYGKLLAVLNEDKPNWDGRYNGKLLPTSDYWFVAKLADGRQFVGHFTLKR